MIVFMCKTEIKSQKHYCPYDWITKGDQVSKQMQTIVPHLIECSRTLDKELTSSQSHSPLQLPKEPSPPEPSIQAPAQENLKSVSKDRGNNERVVSTMLCTKE